ncbi:hypothetical protein [Rubeoparvulum massiliense]|uniref:hypothetical protein n=1 Tax=Rubeoparvulum massiliense TaxID=1631346 RepID=UPI00065E89D0|nr:hypothetical protein [Rubeoparvulum massiliense]
MTYWMIIFGCFYTIIERKRMRAHDRERRIYYGFLILLIGMSLLYDLDYRWTGIIELGNETFGWWTRKVVIP